mgnify:CR=1 FL=1
MRPRAIFLVLLALAAPAGAARPAESQSTCVC